MVLFYGRLTSLGWLIKLRVYKTGVCVKIKKAFKINKVDADSNTIAAELNVKKLMDRRRSIDKYLYK